MKRSGHFSPASLLTILLSAFFLLRIAGRFMAYSPMAFWDLSSASQQWTLAWGILHGVLDVAALFWLFQAREKTKALMGAGAWLAVSFWLESSFPEFTYHSTPDPLPLALGLAFCSTLLWVINRMSIRVRILMVCLFCSGTPMFFLGLAMYRQTQFLLEKSLFPITQDILSRQVHLLDLYLARRINEQLTGLFAIPKGSREFVPESVVTYRQRAKALEIPIIRIREMSLESGKEAELEKTDDSRFSPLFKKHPQSPGYLELRFKDHRQFLTLAIPRKRDQSIIGWIELNIDYGTWGQVLLSKCPLPDRWGYTTFFPIDSRLLSEVFAGYSTESSGSGREPFIWKHHSEDGSGVSEINLLNAMPIRASEDLMPKSAYFLDLNHLRLFSPQGKEWLLLGWNLPNSSFHTIIAIPGDQIRRFLFESHAKTFSFCLLAIFLAILLSILYSGKLSRPIREITEAARLIRDGNLEVSIPPQVGEGEIEELATSLGLMAEQLKGRIALANHQLGLEKAKFETLVESTWEGIFLLSSEGTLLYANHAANQLLGEFSPNEPFFPRLLKIGSDFQPPLPPAPPKLEPGLQEFKSCFKRAISQAGITKTIALYIKSTLNIGHEGTSGGYIAVCRDITIEKEIDQMKNDFVSQVSHELRTPLTSIQAYTEMLLDGEADDAESQKEYLKIIYDESERLTRLINDLLDIARIESGRRVIKPVNLDLCHLSTQILQILGGQAERKKIRLESSLPEAPVAFIGDEDLIKEAGLNLLSNALKYTPNGGTVRISIETKPDGKIAWQFKDSGVGMTPQDRDRLFTKFFRADTDFVRAAGGTGLGLTLVKHIVDLHHGEIQVESRYQQGSAFTILLPPKPSEKPK